MFFEDGRRGSFYNVHEDSKTSSSGFLSSSGQEDICRCIGREPVQSYYLGLVDCGRLVGMTVGTAFDDIVRIVIVQKALLTRYDIRSKKDNSVVY